MSISQLANMVYQVMQVEFTVFGVTINYWDFVIFSVVFSVAIILLRIFRGMY